LRLPAFAQRGEVVISVSFGGLTGGIFDLCLQFFFFSLMGLLASGTLKKSLYPSIDSESDIDLRGRRGDVGEKV
jgi:hypothetical protein